MSLAFAETKPASRFTPFLMTHAIGARGAPTVRIRNLGKGFPMRRGLVQTLRHPFLSSRTPVLHGISLDVGDGELFGVLGLNGAGKTTLLKILATLILPDEGTASVGGHDLLDEPAAVRGMLAMVTADERSLHWRLSALENMRLFGSLHRLSASESFARIVEALETVKLVDAGDKMVGAFSSGMRQRLLLARALLSRPRVLLLDEPTRSLDPVSAHEFRRMLRDEIVGRNGATVILATHNAEEAFTYCDRVAVLHRGRVAALGRARTLAARFGPDIYRIWTPATEHPCFESLTRRGLIAALVRGHDADDGSTVECTIPGGEGAAAEVLRHLVEARVIVSRFERAPAPLPALIARIVEAHESSASGDTSDA